MPPRKKAGARSRPSLSEIKDLSVEATKPTNTEELETEESGADITFPNALGEIVDSVPYFLQPGDEVSLDLRRRQFLILPGLSLSTGSPTGVIPEGTNAEGLACLRRALEHGDIVRGSIHVPVFRKVNGTIKKCIELLEYDSPGMKSRVGKIVQAGYRNYVDGHHPYDLVHAMLKAERDGRNRKAHMHILQSALQFLQDDTFRRGPVGNVKFEDILEDRSRQVIMERKEVVKGKFRDRRPA